MMPAGSDLIHQTPLPLEVAVFSAHDAIRAQRHGAKRVELNATASYDEGGLTPNVSELLSLIPELTVPVRIMIRPRGPPRDGSSDFIYSDEEFSAMRKSIIDFKASGVLNPVRGDGFVFGILEPCLNPQAGPVVVDARRCHELVELARPIGCVFHRAFDPVAAAPSLWSFGIDALIACGFEGVLTSGGPGRCVDNVSRLLDLCRRATGTPLQVVVGGGLRHGNAAEPALQLAQLRSGNVWLHTACIVKNDRTPAGELNAEELAALVGSLSAVTPN